MIIYNKTKKEFISDIEDNLLVEILNQNFKNKLFHYTSDPEKKSWAVNSVRAFFILFSTSFAVIPRQTKYSQHGNYGFLQASQNTCCCMRESQEQIKNAHNPPATEPSVRFTVFSFCLFISPLYHT